MALRVLDAHGAALDAQNAIGTVAELEDIAGQALDREILVDRADENVLRLHLHAVIGIVRNGAAGGEPGEARAFAAANLAVHRIMMDQGAAPATAEGEAVCQHLDDRIEVGARQVAIGPGAAHQGVEIGLGPVLRSHFGNDLLRQHIERLARDGELVQFAAPHAIEQCRAFDEIVAR